MRAKVEQAIVDLGYRPHAGARAMRGRSYTLGILVPENLHNPFISAVVDAITDHVDGTRYVVLIGAGRSTAQDQCRLIEGKSEELRPGQMARPLTQPPTPAPMTEVR